VSVRLSVGARVEKNICGLAKRYLIPSTLETVLADVWCASRFLFSHSEERLVAVLSTLELVGAHRMPQSVSVAPMPVRSAIG
jgi:hypothetical protein